MFLVILRFDKKYVEVELVLENLTIKHWHKTK